MNTSKFPLAEVPQGYQKYQKMQSLQPDPLLPFAEIRTPSLRRAWATVISQARPRRLIREDEGVKGPLWFGSDPNSSLHVFANVLRLLAAIIFAPMWMWLPSYPNPWFRNFFKSFKWSPEWPQAPEALLLESPGSPSKTAGDYAGVEYKPKWLLEVKFRGTEIVSQQQVCCEQDGADRATLQRIEDAGYTTISYPMASAEQLFSESGERLGPQSDAQSDGNKYSLNNRKKILQKVLGEYARARTNNRAKTDGTEFLWLDDFCLSDDRVAEGEATRQRDLEIGKLVDIFRGAKRVVVFCHIIGCDHTGVTCPWSNRLFALSEIMYTPRVIRLTRTHDTNGDDAMPTTTVTVVPGQEFRAAMQAQAAEAKMWHLSNIMQHATNSSGTTWQSTIHSLVVEAIRRVEDDNLLSLNLLGKALNGLLPRRSQLADLQGVDGWADLAWLLELNQGYYNSATLAAVCKLADPHANSYRWWGKLAMPKEGCERLDPLTTTVPVKFRDEKTGSAVPALSFVGPKIIPVDDTLQRDSGALERQPEMASLKFWSLVVWVFVTFLGALLGGVIGSVGSLLYWIVTILYVTLQLMVGTIYVRKDKWVVIEDYRAPGRDAYRYLQFRDPSYTRRVEWSSQQLIPTWDVPYSTEPRTLQGTAHPYTVTLIDLQTGAIVRTIVTSRPNSIALLAVHGNGITCMLLDRDLRANVEVISVKVGMANLPPYALSQAVRSGNIYVGGHAFRQMRPPVPFLTWVRGTLSKDDPEETRRYLSATVNMKHSHSDLGPQLVPMNSISSTAPILRPSEARLPYRKDTNSSVTTITGDSPDWKSQDHDESPPVTFRYREGPAAQWFPERRGAENV